MTDNASSKIGKFIPGSNIPIITLTNALKLNPKVLIIFPWNIFEELKSEILDLSKKLNLKVPKILSVRDKFFLK